jgi:hypothetical protein
VVSSSCGYAAVFVVRLFDLFPSVPESHHQRYRRGVITAAS